jgi:RNA polymerase sigma-70 factor, ECF subfamily
LWWLADALPRLSENDRDVLTLTAWEGLSHAEAGEVLGCSPAAVAVRLHRARGRLEALRPSTSSAPRNVLEGATHEP